MTEPKRDRVSLKQEFKDGERPSGNDFADFIDSFIHKIQDDRPIANQSTDGISIDADGNIALPRGLRLGNSAGTQAGGLRFNGTQAQFHDGTNWVNIVTGTGGVFQPMGTGGAVTYAGGNVGIGSFTAAAAPTYRFEVNLGENKGTTDRVRFGHAVCSNGTDDLAEYALFSHDSLPVGNINSGYALRQGPDGDTYINAVDKQVVSIRQNDAVRLGVSKNGNVIVGGETELMDGLPPKGRTEMFQVAGASYFKGSIGIGSFKAAPAYRLEVNLGESKGTAERVRFGHAVCSNGTDDLAEYALFSHDSLPVGNINSGYALRQGPDGDTYINAVDKQVVSIRQNDEVRLGISKIGNVIVGGETELKDGLPPKDRTEKFQVAGTAYIKGNLTLGASILKPDGSVWNPSDARVKEDVRDLEAGLAQLQQVRPVRFRFNGRAGTVARQAGVGIIAQEMEKIFPEMIQRIPGGFDNDPTQEDLLVYDGSALTYVLVNAVKELAAKVEKLEKDLADALKNSGNDRNPT